MNKKIIIAALVAVVMFGLGVFVGYKVFYGDGCPDCVFVQTTDVVRDLTEQELIDKYQIKSGANSGINTRGNKVEQQGDKYLVTVYMGTKKTGGYYLVVKSVTNTKDGIEIVVKEVSPSVTDIVTQAFTSPYITLLVDSNNVKVLTPNGDNYSAITRK